METLKTLVWHKDNFKQEHKNWKFIVYKKNKYWRAEEIFSIKDSKKKMDSIFSISEVLNDSEDLENLKINPWYAITFIINKYYENIEEYYGNVAYIIGEKDNKYMIMVNIEDDDDSYQFFLVPKKFFLNLKHEELSSIKISNIEEFAITEEKSEYNVFCCKWTEIYNQEYPTPDDWYDNENVKWDVAIIEDISENIIEKIEITDILTNAQENYLLIGSEDWWEMSIKFIWISPEGEFLYLVEGSVSRYVDSGGLSDTYNYKQTEIYKIFFEDIFKNKVIRLNENTEAEIKIKSDKGSIKKYLTINQKDFDNRLFDKIIRVDLLNNKTISYVGIKDWKTYIIVNKKEFYINHEGSLENTSNELIDYIVSSNTKQITYIIKEYNEYSLYVNWKLKWETSRKMSSLFFSPNEKHLWCYIKSYEWLQVLIDSEEISKAFDNISKIVFSPNEKHFAYIGIIEYGKYHIIVDWKEKGTFEKVEENSLKIDNNWKVSITTIEKVIKEKAETIKL